MGAHMCSAPLPGTEKTLWEHYNELRAKLDASQFEVWHDMTNTALLIVRLPPSLSNFPVPNDQVVKSLRGHPFNISRLHPPTANQ